jgi:hypothetical protein
LVLYSNIILILAIENKEKPIFTALHTLWYRWDSDQRKYIKIIPDCIGEMFSVISLAHWIIEDGYFDNHGRTKTVLLCTESFTKEECVYLQEVLSNYGIKTSLKVRDLQKDTYRIRVSKLSMPLLRELVVPHMHPDFPPVFTLRNL